MNSRYLVPLLCLTGLPCLTSVSAQTGVNVPRVIDTYCSGCHNGRMRSPSGVLLDTFDAAQFDATKISSTKPPLIRSHRDHRADETME